MGFRKNTSDFRIKRFFRGIYSLRPPTPKYSHTWDSAIVLSFIKNMPDNQTLFLEELTYKVAIPLALATGQRVQTLANIEISNIIQNERGIEIKIPKRLKTTGKGVIQPTLLLPVYDKGEDISPARTLLAYLTRTEDVRGASKNLFITFKKPFHNDLADYF